MVRFRTALTMFTEDKLKLEQLVQVLEESLKKYPERSTELLSYLNTCYQEKKLAEPVYSQLQAKIELFLKEEDEDATRLPASVVRRARNQTYARTTKEAPSRFTSSTGTATTATHKTSTFTSTKTGTFTGHSILRQPEQWEHIEEEEDIFQAGRIIRDSYRLEEILGEGGMGVVWKAVDLIQEAGEARDSYVAIKFLSKDFKQHPDALKALVREFGRYKKLIHPNIVKAYELSRIGEIVFIVMELLEGIPLDKFIKTHQSGIPLNEAEPIIRGMSEALAYAHKQGIAHLDFKPANVFYNPTQKEVKVIDFGIAQLVDPSEREKTKFKVSELGALTEHYASCEMLAELEPTPSDDIYALACVSYELLSGKHPFHKKKADQAKIKKLTPRPLKILKRKQYQALLHGLAFERDNRTATAEQFLAEFFSSKTKSVNKYILATAGTAIVVLTIVVAVPFITNLRQENLIECISQGEESCIKRLENADSQTQTKILQKNQVKKGLVQFYLWQTDRDVVQQIEVFDESIQKNLFGDNDVKETLITHYVTQIDSEIEQDHFEQASTLLTTINRKYADSKTLSDKVQEIEQRKNQRVADLAEQYQNCLSETQRPLTEMTPCISEARQKITHLVPQHELLNDASLPKIYGDAAEQALQENQIQQAEELLLHWEELRSENLPRRDTLWQKVTHRKEVEKWLTEITSGDHAKIANATTKLASVDEILRNDVLENAEVQESLLSYYQDNSNSKIQTDDFPSALQLLDEALTLLAAFPDARKALTSQKKKIAKRKTELVAQLKSDYQERVTTCANPEQISAVQHRLLKIESDDYSAYPGLAEGCANLMAKLLPKRGYEQSQTVLATWEKLLPNDTEQRIALRDKLKVGIHQDKERLTLSQNIRKALAQDNESVIREIALIQLQNLDADSLKLFQQDFRDTLTDYYLEKAQTQVESDRFPEALVLLETGLKIYPNSKSLQKTQNKLSSQKTKRLKALKQQYQAILKDPELSAKAITEVLKPVQIIEPDNALLNYPGVADTFAQQTEQALTNKNYERAQQLLQEWKQLLPAETEQYVALVKRRQEDIEKDKQLIALTQELKTAIEGGNEPAFQTAVNTLKETFKADDQRHILNNVQQAYLAYYTPKVEAELQNRNFEQAVTLLQEPLKLYPDSKTLQGLIDKARAGNKGYLDALAKDVWKYKNAGKWLPDGSSGESVVEVLNRIKNIDPNHAILKNTKLHQAFDRRIRQLVISKGDTTPQIKAMFHAWDNSLQFNSRNAKTLKFARNYVWLFYRKQGFRAKNRGDNEKAIKYFMFILELDWKKEINRTMARKVEEALAELM